MKVLLFRENKLQTHMTLCEKVIFTFDWTNVNIFTSYLLYLLTFLFAPFYSIAYFHNWRCWPVSLYMFDCFSFCLIKKNESYMLDGNKFGNLNVNILTFRWHERWSVFAVGVTGQRCSWSDASWPIRISATWPLDRISWNIIPFRVLFAATFTPEIFCVNSTFTHFTSFILVFICTLHQLFASVLRVSSKSSFLPFLFSCFSYFPPLSSVISRYLDL